MVQFRDLGSKTVVNPDGAMLMSKGREIRCYDYVNHSYERVRDALQPLFNTWT
jgi:hypothetical protein